MENSPIIDKIILPLLVDPLLLARALEDENFNDLYRLIEVDFMHKFTNPKEFEE
jgi:hypothetical protein